MVRFVFLFLVALSAASAAWGGCWDAHEKARMETEELDGSTVLSFKDAVSCEPIVNAPVKLGGDPFTTDGKGYIIFKNESFKGMMDERFPLVVTPRGYIPLETELEILLESVRNKRFLLSPFIPVDKARFVLQWGWSPEDLDLHLVGPDFHVSYRQMRNSAGKATLDRDDLSRVGPETITLDRIDPQAKYAVYVHNYSGRPSMDESVQVYVYLKNKLERIAKLPTTAKTAVKVVELHRHRATYPMTASDRVPDYTR